MTHGVQGLARLVPQEPAVADGPRMVRRLRLEIGLSQNQFARRSGVDPAYINRIEKQDGHASPSRAVVLRMSDVLGLDVDEADRLLYAFGHAGRVDWQAAWERVAAAMPAVVEAAVIRSMAETLAAAIAAAEPLPADANGSAR